MPVNPFVDNEADEQLQAMIINEARGYAPLPYHQGIGEDEIPWQCYIAAAIKHIREAQRATMRARSLAKLSSELLNAREGIQEMRGDGEPALFLVVEFADTQQARAHVTAWFEQGVVCEGVVYGPRSVQATLAARTNDARELMRQIAECVPAIRRSDAQTTP